MIRARDTGWIGVDVGTYSVKLAQVERRSGRYALSEAVVIQRSEPWCEIGTDKTAVRDSAEELIAGRALGERFAGRKAAAALPMAICQLKSLQLADGTEEARRAAITAELASNPLPGGRLREFDFWPINSPLENATIVRENVSVLSIASDWAYRLAADHQTANLACQALDGMPLALSRAVGMCERADTAQPVAVLDWGFSRTTFCIVFDGRPLFVRCLRDCEYGAVIRALRDDLALNWDEARRVAIDHVARPASYHETKDELQLLVSEVVVASMNQLIAELQRTLVYLKMHRNKLMPTQMWVFGGGAAVKGIAPWLRERVDLDVQCWHLGDPTYRSASAGEIPMAMLGPAVALSALAWEAS